MSSATVSELANMITVHTDLDEVEIAGEVYTGVLKRPKKELSQWLYCVLHAGNSHLLDDNNGQDLTEKINNCIDDSTLKVPAAYEIVRGEKYAVTNGVRVYAPIVNGEIELPSKRPNLTPGFFMFVSMNELGKYRHYVGAANPEEAINFWAEGIKRLQGKGYKFSAKVLSNTGSYPRNDAIVFYSNSDKVNVEKELILLAEELVIDSSKLTGSPFMDALVNSLGYGEQPLDSNGIHESLGEQRTKLLALAIRDVFTTGLDLKVLITQRFKKANINLDNVALNA